MSATVVLTLDTAGPSVVWGPPTGATAGGTLRVPYVADESLTTATLTDSGRTLSLTVGPDAVTGVLPADWPTGLAGVTVTDDVGNAATYAALIPVDGVTPIPPVVTGGGWGVAPPPRLPARSPRVFESATRTAELTRITITTTTTSALTFRTASRTSATARATTAAHVEATNTITGRALTRSAWLTATNAATTVTVWPRPEDWPVISTGSLRSTRPVSRADQEAVAALIFFLYGHRRM